MTRGVAILGVGRMGLLRGATIVRHSRDFHLVGVADPVQSARDRAAELLGVDVFADWRTLVDVAAVQAVLVCSATPAHAEQVLAAVTAGKHVLCEKPLAQTIVETEAAVAAAAAAGVVLHPGFNRRFDPGFAAARRAVTEGRVGRPLLLRISSRDPELPPASYPRWPGGLFADTSIHDFDMARFLLGEEVVEVSAFASALVDDLAADQGDADTAGSMLRLASGALAVIDNCRLSAYGYDQRAEVHGTAGTVLVGNAPGGLAALADSGGIHHPALPWFFPERYQLAYQAELDSFAATIGGAPPIVTGADARQDLAICLAAQQSAQERRVIPVDTAQLVPTSVITTRR